MSSISIHMGLDAVDAGHYNGWTGALGACEFDATDLAAIARVDRFTTTTLLTRAATTATLLGMLSSLAATLWSGDRLLVTFAGHGAQVPDANGDEAAGVDETWVMYDRMLIDDELYAALSRFRAGVGVVIIADSCHSGTSARVLPSIRDRSMPAALARAVFEEHDRTYGRALAQAYGASSDDLACSGLLLAGCQDNQVALDGNRNGLFTGTLKSIWAGGRFNGSYADAIRLARAAMPRYQYPNLLTLGPSTQPIELDRLFA